MINAAGGAKKWESLSEIERNERTAFSMEQLVIRLGKEHYNMLSDEQQQVLKLFIWVGCGCHKDLNTVRGGNSAMMSWWKLNGVTPPIALPNRDNAATMKDGLQSDTVLPSQERATKSTDSGGIKAAELAGNIFNHKNDTKGYHDTFRLWWEANVGENFTFPDTSNTRFQSHCEAATVLLQYLPIFKNFLMFVCDKKQQR